MFNFFLKKKASSFFEKTAIPLDSENIRRLLLTQENKIVLCKVTLLCCAFPNSSSLLI